MYIGDKLEELIQNFDEKDIMSNKKVNVEFDYEDLIHVVIALKEKSSNDDKIINAYESQ
jgi:hypothetical protein